MHNVLHYVFTVILIHQVRVSSLGKLKSTYLRQSTT